LLSDYQISTIREAWVVLVYLLLLSGLYWYNSKLFSRSAHGIVLFFGLVYAVVISEYTQVGAPDYYNWPLHLILIVGLVSVVFSFRAFQGKKWVHLIHVLTIISAFWVWFIGSMAISHDWL